MLGRQARSRRYSGGSSDEYFLHRLDALRVHGLIAAGRAAHCHTTSTLSDNVPGCPPRKTLQVSCHQAAIRMPTLQAHSTGVIVQYSAFGKATLRGGRSWYPSMVSPSLSLSEKKTRREHASRCCQRARSGSWLWHSVYLSPLMLSMAARVLSHMLILLADLSALLAVLCTSRTLLPCPPATIVVCRLCWR